jgi:hypothetical protein
LKPAGPDLAVRNVAVHETLHHEGRRSKSGNSRSLLTRGLDYNWFIVITYVICQISKLPQLIHWRRVRVFNPFHAY